MNLVLVAALLVIFAGPIALGLVGLFRSEAATTTKQAWDVRLTAASTLTYALAFNLVFFWQELFLVLPKAMVPGLRPTLFHNNHDWSGSDPIAELLQGTGALAIFVLGVACAALLARRPPQATTTRLLVFWLAFHGLFMSLAQVVVGAMVPQNDVGRAMTWLGFGAPGKTAAAFAALGLIVAAATWLTPRLVEMASRMERIDGGARRSGFVFATGALPAIVGTLLILPFRAPGHPIEVAVVPAAVGVIGLGWIQAGAWRASATPRGQAAPAILWPLLALAALLAIFQIVLRPGIAFGA